MHSPATPSHAKKPRADSTSPSLLESFDRIKLKGKDAMIEKLNTEINGLKKDKAKLEEKVRKLLEFIGGSCCARSSTRW